MPDVPHDNRRPPPSKKRYRRGTHRAVMPDETVARLRPLMPVMGITRVANVTGLDVVGLPVVMVCRPNARSLAVSQGKGLDLSAARASGLMEAVEMYHAEHIDLPLKWASYEELRYTHPVAEIDRLPRSPQGRFHPDLPLLWIEGRRIDAVDAQTVHGPALWLPFELVHANYTVPAVPGSGGFSATTNGLASGNDLLEATLHGLCEIVERDARTLWTFSSAAARRRTGVDLATVDDPDCRAALDRFAQAGLRPAVWDVTSDVAIPCYFCLVIGEGDDAGPAAIGAGCHPSRAVALARALTEAAQIRLTYIAGSRDDLSPAEYSENALARRAAACRAWLEAHEPVRDFAAAPSWSRQTFQEDLVEALSRLSAAGLDTVFVVDLTKPAFGIPVVRVIVPGLEALYEDADSDYVPGERALSVLRSSL